ncbi:MAG: hypothetical protein WHV26_06805 [Spirochaetota bacterium]
MIEYIKTVYVHQHAKTVTKKNNIIAQKATINRFHSKFIDTSYVK